MPRLGRKLEVEVTDRGGTRMVSEGEAIRHLARSGCFPHTVAQKLLEGSADSGTEVRTNYSAYSAHWLGRPALEVVGNLDTRGCYTDVIKKKGA